VPEADREAPTGTESHKWMRSAGTALRELAPFNTFYAEGRKVVIDQVDTGGRGNAPEVWHFCKECSYCERAMPETVPTRTCPACGSMGWEDVGQQRTLIRLAKVSAEASDRASRVDDGTDERDMTTYEYMDLVSVLPADSDGGQATDTVPFGYEFLPKATMRSINFGPVEHFGNQVQIAGQRISEAGFTICQDCGRVVPDTSAGSRTTRHRRYCHFRASDRDEKWHDANLYREVTSEALRLLVPTEGHDSERRRATIRACIQLGIRLKLGGDPGHIEIREQYEPSVRGGGRQFMVLFDAVPGGTGTLRQLAKSGDLVDALRMALDALRACPCGADEQRDGCYRCLFAYHAQRDLRNISRQLGIDILTRIVENAGELQAVQSLCDVPTATSTESELERRFVEALEKRAKTEPDMDWRPKLQSGKQCYRLRIGERVWVIEPQVQLGPQDGVALPCKPDFLLRPEYEASGDLPVAVFCDGAQYHVLGEHGESRVADDIAKRQSIVASGRYIVWTVTWHCVEAFERDTANASVLHIWGLAGPARTLIQRSDPQGVPPNIASVDAVSALLYWLRHPSADSWQTAADCLCKAAVSRGDPYAVRQEDEDRVLSEALAGGHALPAAPVDASARVAGLFARGAAGLTACVPRDPAARSSAAVLFLNDSEGLRTTEGFIADWRGFWEVANLLQFAPRHGLASSEMRSEGQVGAIIERVAVPTEPEPEIDGLEYCDPALHGLLRDMLHAGLPLPVIGYETLDERGFVAGQVELAWEPQQAAVYTADQDEGAVALRGQGWAVLPSHEASIDVLRDLLDRRDEQ